MKDNRQRSYASRRRLSRCGVHRDFYRWLSDRGLVIYPGKLTDAYGFRVGTIPMDILARAICSPSAALRARGYRFASFAAVGFLVRRRIGLAASQGTVTSSW